MVPGHLRQKNGMYYIVLNLKDQQGNRKAKWISTKLPVKGNKKKAETLLIQARQEYTSKQEDSLAQPENLCKEILFADFMEQWLEVIRSEVKITTFGGYQSNVQRIITPYFRKQGITLQELTAKHINDFYREQLGRVKASTVHKYHANISKAIKYAVEEELIEHSVMERVKRPKLVKTVGKFLKEQEVLALFEAVRGHKLEFAVIIAAFYGLRLGEVTGLRWDAINFDANTITIQHTVTTTYVDGKRRVVESDTAKSKSSFRTLPLMPPFRRKLLEMKAQQESYRKLCGRCYNKREGQYIYVDQMGNRVKNGYVSSEFPKFMEEHGFRRISFHQLRHSSASLLIANGVPLKQVQEWLGHSDFSITANTYAHLDYQSKMDAAKAMTWLNKTSLAHGAQPQESPNHPSAKQTPT